MFKKIRDRLTSFLSTFALLNAAAFSGFLMSQAEVEEIEINHFNGNSIVASVKLPKEKFLQAVNNEISHEEFILFMESLKKEFQKLTQSIM